MRIWRGGLGVMLLAILATSTACSKMGQESGRLANAGPGMPSPAGAFLAYEHSVRIALPAAEIQGRLQAVQASCTSGKFGECTVLNVERIGGEYPSGSLAVRIVPEGVEPMIAQAGSGGEIGSRITHAEDLAQVVRDNERQQQRLKKERERLLEFQQRRDLSVADMIALSERLAESDARLESTEQDAAQHRRRIDTQLLTLSFASPAGQASRSEIGQALRDFGGIVATSAAWVIRAVAVMIPVGTVLALLWMCWRRLRRKRI